MCNKVIEFNPTPFGVNLTFGPTSFEAEHPSDLTEAEAERLLVAVMFVVYETGHDAWALLDKLEAAATTSVRSVRGR